MTSFARCAVCFCVGACILLAASCGGGQTVRTDPPGGPAADFALPPSLGLVPFPSEDEPAAPRLASAIAAMQIDASGSYRESDNTSEIGLTREFSAGAGQIAWAIYRFDSLADWHQLTSMSMEFSELPEVYYMGVANFATGRWQWFERGTSTGGDNPVDTLLWPGGIDGISPNGNCYTVALFFDGASSVLDRAAITWSTDFNGPYAELDATPQRGNASLQVTLDASGSIDANGSGIAKYEWDWEGDGIYDETGAASTVQHTYTEIGDYFPMVRATDTDDNLTDTAQTAIRVQGWQHSFGGTGQEIVENVTYQGDSVFAVGQATVSDEVTNTEGLLISYDRQGNIRWEKTWGGGLETDVFLACAGVYGNGFVAVGQGANFGTAGLGIFVVRVDSGGNILWARSWDTPGADIASGVAVDLSGNIFVAGHTSGLDVDAYFDGLVLKYSPAGDLLWETALVNTDQTMCRDVEVDLSGHVYVAADTASYAYWSSATVFHLDADGNLVKESPLDVGNPSHAEGLELDYFGDVYLCGNVNIPNEALLAAALDSDGDYSWAKGWDFADSSRGRDVILRYGQFANVTAMYVGGYANNQNPLRNLGVLVQWAPNGTYVGAHQWLAAGDIVFRDITAGRYGAVLFGGAGEVAAATISSANSPELEFLTVDTVVGTATAESVSGTGKSITGSLRELDGVLDSGGGIQDSWVGSFVPEDL